MYQCLRSNAKRRGHLFTITLDDYKEVWEEHPDKLAEKVQGLYQYENYKCPWTIDRIDSSKGYEKGNLRVVHRMDNSRYYWNEKKGAMEWQKFHLSTSVEEWESWGEDCPF